MDNTQDDGFLSDEQVLAWLRTKGLVGPLIADLINDMRGSVMDRGFSKALQETGAYPPGQKGADASLADFLKLIEYPDAIERARNMPADTPVAIVCRRAGAIMKADLATPFVD